MDLSIVYVSSIFLLFTQIVDVDLTHGNQFNPRNKVVELTEIVKLMLEENNAKYKQVDNLSKEIQDFKSRSGYKIRKLEQELASSRKSLSTAIDKINNMEKSGKNIHFNAILKDKMVDLEKTRDVPKSDDNLFQNKVPRFLLQNETNNIAFSVVMDTHKENLAIHQTVQFDRVITNDGSGYDPNSSVFKAPVAGLYYFTVVIMSHAREDIETEIVRNGVPVVNTYSGDSTTWNAGPQSTVLSLAARDSVYVRMLNNPTVNNGNVRVFGYGWSSFSGFRIST